MASRNPTTWDEYERGLSPHRSGSVSSTGERSVQFREDESLLGAVDEDDHDEEWPGLRRRRSSITNRLTALTDIGGVNSIRSFTRSWQRAAGFAEVIPQRPSFVFAPDQVPVVGAADAIQYGRSDPAAGHPIIPRTSLLRQHLEAGSSPETGAAAAAAAMDESPGSPVPGASSTGGDGRRRSDYLSPGGEQKTAGDEDEPGQAAFAVGSVASNIFSVPPYLSGSPIFGGSYGSYRSYGSISTGASLLPAGARQAGAALWRRQQEAGGNVPDGELPPILVKEVEEDGKIILTVEGQSTLPQTIFNSINVLIGVGLLSLPMGIKYAGWLCGMATLLCCALVTAYTARLLARCMELDPIVITFSDLAYISFGPRARLATSVLFTLELLAACVALIVLFADSLDLLFPDLLTVTEWKVVCSLILVPLNFLPLRFLSFTSIIGIVSCFSIVLIVVIDGFTKQTSPGSLIEPAKTYLFPANWLTLPLSFGLLMSPWGGHSVFPNIYRDMRHTYRYGQAIKITFCFTYLLDAVTAVAGVLMFGDDIMDEITSNILKTSGYPRILTFLMCLFIAILPLTKIPLNARPIITTVEILTGLHQQSVADSSALVGRSMYFRGAMKVAIRVATIICFLAISIVFPAFDSIMAFMGSALCFTICVTLPLAFYLKLFSEEITTRERILAYSLMTISAILSVVGTIWAFLPKALIGAE